MVQCGVCSKEFTPLSMVGIARATTVIRCPDCENRNKVPVAIKNLNKDVQNEVLSITSRIEKLEKLVQTTVESLVQAKLFELESKIIENLETKLDEDMNSFLKDFQEKIQMQVVTLNNRLLKIEGNK